MSFHGLLNLLSSSFGTRKWMLFEFNWKAGETGIDFSGESLSASFAVCEKAPFQRVSEDLSHWKKR